MGSRAGPLLLAGVVGAAFASASAAQSAECLTVREHRLAVRSGEVVKPAAINRAVDGEVLQLTLCRHDGRLVYHATVLEPGGRVRNHLIDARNGQVMK